MAKSKQNSPEAKLGLQLEEALSPKSQNNKKRKNMVQKKLALQGKLEVTKKRTNKIAEPMKQDNVIAKKKGKKQKEKTVSEDSNAQSDSKSSLLKHVNALNAVNALLKTVKAKDSELLDSDDYIYLQFGLVKLAKDSRGVHKVLLPHCILPDSPEVCLITSDLKGKRNDPEEAIDHYKEILKQNNISVVTEIIPVRKLKQEYSQFEEQRKLANRLDFIINDGRITRVAKLGKRFARSKKCICAINMSSKTLKDDIEKALRKVAIFTTGNGTSFTVKCGRKGMSAAEITDNIMAIGEFFANNESLIGEPQNISSVYVKMALSKAFPIYVSTVTPNEVHVPKGKVRNNEEPVEDEVTTVEGATVVVYPSGNVRVKKRKHEENVDKTLEQPSGKKVNSVKTKKNISSLDVSCEDVDASDSSFGSSPSSEASLDSESENDFNMEGKGIEAVEKAYLKELSTVENGTDKQKVSVKKVPAKKGINIKGKKVDQQGTKGIPNQLQKKKITKKQQGTKGIPNQLQKKKITKKQQSNDQTLGQKKKGNNKKESISPKGNLRGKKKFEGPVKKNKGK